MKKILFGIYFWSVIMSVFAQQYDSEGDYVVEMIDNGRAVRITGYNGNNTVVRIPPRIQNLPVTDIGEEAFAEKRLASVTIPNGVIVIGDYAFCENQLTSIIIPNSVSSMGEGAFSDNNISSVTIPNSVTSIANYLFSANKLTTLTIPNSVTIIGTSAFRSNQLTNVSIPNNVSSIGNRAFEDNQLTSITIPNSVTSIGSSAFANNRLTSVTIGNRVTTIGNNAFSKNRLASISIPNGITTIGSGAFTENQLASVIIPNSVVNIGNFAFAENRLTSATIQNGSAVIALNAFWANYNLTGITVANTTRTLNQWPDLDRYHKIVWEEINDYSGRVGFNDAEIERLYASLGGDLNIADTPLEGALVGYFRRISSQLNDAAESILPHSNPRQVDLQLGVFVYAGLILNRYLNNTAITASHEAMLNFIASRGNVTRTEIEAHYRNGIGNLISGMVDTELWTVRFLIPIRGGEVTRNGITRAGAYNAELTRKNGVYVLTYRHRISVILSDASLDALLNKVRNVDDFYYFETNVIDLIRSEAAKMPLSTPDATITSLKESLTNFFLTPNQTTFNQLKRIYQTSQYNISSNIRELLNLYNMSMGLANYGRSQGWSSDIIQQSVDEARKIRSQVEPMLRNLGINFEEASNGTIDLDRLASLRNRILYSLNSELPQRIK